MSNYLICWDCRVENETVTYSEKDGSYCPKCRDRFYNNYNLVCQYCDKKYIQITERMVLNGLVISVKNVMIS